MVSKRVLRGICGCPIDLPAPLRHSSRSLRRSGPTVRSPARGAICHASIEQYKFCSHKKTTEFLKRTLSHAGSFQEAARPKNGRVFSLAPYECFQCAPGPSASAAAGTSTTKEALLWRSERRDARGRRVALPGGDTSTTVVKEHNLELVDEPVAVRAPRRHGHRVRLDGLAALEVPRAPDVRRERVLLGHAHVELARVLGDALAVDAAHV